MSTPDPTPDDPADPAGPGDRPEGASPPSPDVAAPEPPHGGPPRGGPPPPPFRGSLPPTPPPAAPPYTSYGSSEPRRDHTASPYRAGSATYAIGPVDKQGRPLASWWQRFAAIVIDEIILSAPQFFVTDAAISSSGISAKHVGTGAIVLGAIFTIVDVVYFAWMNGSPKGQTVGQMALGIAVRDQESGGAIGSKRAGYRIIALEPGILLRWVPVLGLLAGLYTIVCALSPLWDENRQGFHDKAVKTDVIQVR